LYCISYLRGRILPTGEDVRLAYVSATFSVAQRLSGCETEQTASTVNLGNNAECKPVKSLLY